MICTLSLLSIKHLIRDCRTLYCLTIQVLLFASDPICVLFLHCDSILTGSNFVFVLSRFDLQDRSNIIVLQGVGVLNMHNEDMFYPRQYNTSGQSYGSSLACPAIKHRLPWRCKSTVQNELFQKKREENKNIVQNAHTQIVRAYKFCLSQQHSSLAA